MIQVRTSPDGTRTITLPRGLLDVAVSVTNLPERDAAFHMARRLSLDALATLERIALNRGHAAAVERAEALLLALQGWERRRGG